VIDASSRLEALPPFHPEAQAELVAAAHYYEEQRSGLGDDFLTQVEQALAVALQYPSSGTPLGSGFRWVLTQRFRYAVVYREIENGIIVIAVAHLRRRPGYWRKRK
jgi:hypothetical protein